MKPIPSWRVDGCSPTHRPGKHGYPRCGGQRLKRMWKFGKVQQYMASSKKVFVHVETVELFILTGFDPRVIGSHVFFSDLFGALMLDVARHPSVCRALVCTTRKVATRISLGLFGFLFGIEVISQFGTPKVHGLSSSSPSTDCQLCLVYCLVRIHRYII